MITTNLLELHAISGFDMHISIKEKNSDFKPFWVKYTQNGLKSLICAYLGRFESQNVIVLGPERVQK